MPPQAVNINHPLLVNRQVGQQQHQIIILFLGALVARADEAEGASLDQQRHIDGLAPAYLPESLAIMGLLLTELLLVVGFPQADDEVQPQLLDQVYEPLPAHIFAVSDQSHATEPIEQVGHLQQPHSLPAIRAALLGQVDQEEGDAHPLEEYAQRQKVEFHLAEFPARGVHQHIAVALAFVEPTDELTDNRPQYPLPQHALAEALVEEACEPTVERVAQRGGLARYGPDLILDFIQVHAFLHYDAANNDEQRLDSCLLGFW